VVGMRTVTAMGETLAARSGIGVGGWPVHEERVAT
jgi:hypothetical protein